MDTNKNKNKNHTPTEMVVLSCKISLQYTPPPPTYKRVKQFHYKQNIQKLEELTSMIYTQKQRNITQSSELVKLPYELTWNLSSKELQLQFSYP
jgi:hypothetical protein